MKFNYLLTALVLCTGFMCNASVPVLTIKGSRDTNFLVNTAYNAPEATAYDDEDGDISQNIEVFYAVDNQIINEGFAAYKVEDSDGNIVKDTIWVNVIDTLPPEVSPKFGDTLAVLVNSSFLYLDYFIFSDNYDPPQLLEDNHQLVFSDLNLAKPGVYSVTVRTKDASENWSKNGTLYVEVVMSLGVIEDFNNSFQVYPNPSKGIVNIKFTGTSIGPYRYTITTTVGQLVKSSESMLSINETLDLSELSSGIFYINIDFNNHVYSDRLIIY
jgi:hypothetical protein